MSSLALLTPARSPSNVAPTQAKHLPLFLKICFRELTPITVVKSWVACYCCKRGFPSHELLTEEQSAVLYPDSFVLDCELWRGWSHATNSSSNSRRRFSIVSSASEDTFLLTMSLRSGGSLARSTDDNMDPYEAATPSDFKLRMCDSVVSRRSLRWLSEDTASAFNNVSMCLDIIICLFPNLFFTISTASQ